LCQVRHRTQITKESNVRQFANGAINVAEEKKM